MQSYISDWVYLQKILNQPYDKTYVSEIKDGEVDSCNAYNDVYCPYNPEGKPEIICRGRVNSKSNKVECINSNRIKPFLETNDEPIITPNGEYIIIKTFREMYMFTYELICKMFSTDSVCFVLFSPGSDDLAVEINSNETFHTIFFNDFFGKILKKMELIQKPEGFKFVIGGHSMGCILALHFGYKLFTENKSLFKNNVLIIGSGAVQCLSNEKDTAFNDLPNVVIFYSANSDGKTDCRILPKQTKFKDFRLYTPFYILKQEPQKSKSKLKEFLSNPFYLLKPPKEPPKNQLYKITQNPSENKRTFANGYQEFTISEYNEECAEILHNFKFYIDMILSIKDQIISFFPEFAYNPPQKIPQISAGKIKRRRQSRIKSSHRSRSSKRTYRYLSGKTYKQKLRSRKVFTKRI